MNNKFLLHSITVACLLGVPVFTDARKAKESMAVNCRR